ncbi:MAG: proline--tRNA ligase [Burkholderiaceae bacterium]|nr:proline--tRNA ligase [Burkholderiaceae bacterium]
MRISRFHFQTLKEDPSDAEVISHKLMLRAAMIRRLGAGIYNYMPLGLRVIRKVERIIREEMDRAGAIELLMPLVQPAELWMETGRWEKMGPELLRVKDRHGRDFAIQPTSEEVITDIARQELKSWRQLPKNFYHIQTKFRDERRPRFGVMRGREFTMKDAYSFDRDVAGAEQSYDVMFACYCRIFDRLGLTYRAVAADTGAIGGSRSHEFQVIADTGEDAIVYCPQSDFAANIELAEAVCLLPARGPATEPVTVVPTPGKSTCADVAALLGLPLQRTVKSIVLATDARNQKGEITETRVWLLLLRGDHDLNEVKAGKVAGLDQGFRFASTEEIEAHFGCKPGYLGPVKMRRPVSVIADRTVANMSDFVTGANQWDHHIRGVNWGRDLPEPDLVADIRNVVEGDPSPDGKGALAIQRGIEVGHVFYLGTKYSEAMKATYLDETGKPALMEMGCYGIGVTRIVGAAIEQGHDAKGIIWPASIAPFEVVICPVGAAKSDLVKAESEAIYQELIAAGIDVALDDRDERPGAMFADWELIGVPVRVTVGERSLKEGKLELLQRVGMVASTCERAEVLAAVRALM